MQRGGSKLGHSKFLYFLLLLLESFINQLHQNSLLRTF